MTYFLNEKLLKGFSTSYDNAVIEMKCLAMIEKIREEKEKNNARTNYIFHHFIRVSNLSYPFSYFYSLLKKVEIWTKHSRGRPEITSEKIWNPDNGRVSVSAVNCCNNLYND